MKIAAEEFIPIVNGVLGVWLLSFLTSTIMIVCGVPPIAVFLYWAVTSVWWAGLVLAPFFNRPQS